MSFSERTLSCVAAGFFFFYTIFQKVIFNVISKNLISHFHLSVTALGGVSSVYLYANALWLIPGGILLERFSARHITLLFMLLCALSSFVFAYSSSILLDALMRFIGGLGSAMSLLIALRLAARLFPQHSARVVGLLVSFGMSAGFFANAPFLHLVQLAGWQESLSLTGYFGLIITCFMFLFLHDKKTTQTTIQDFSFSNLYQDMKIILTHVENWKAGIYIGFMNLPIFILASLWGNLYLVHTAGYSMEKTTWIISMIFIGEISGAPILGWLADQLQRKKLVMIGGAIASFIVSVFIFDLTVFSVFELSGLFFLLGFTLSAQVIGYSVIAENNDPSLISVASGFGSFIVNMLGAICQVLFPVLLMFNKNAGLASAYKTAYLMFPAAFLLSIFVAIYLTEKPVYAINTAFSDKKLLSQS